MKRGEGGGGRPPDSRANQAPPSSSSGSSRPLPCHMPLMVVNDRATSLLPRLPRPLLELLAPLLLCSHASPSCFSRTRSPNNGCRNRAYTPVSRAAPCAQRACYTSHRALGSYARAAEDRLASDLSPWACASTCGACVTMPQNSCAGGRGPGASQFWVVSHEEGGGGGGGARASQRTLR